MAADWKEIVGAVAPGLATVLGGPVAGLAVSALSRQLLGRGDGTEAEVAAAVASGGGEVLQRIKQAELDFQVRLRELDIDVDKIHQADRASARDREARTGDVVTPRALAFLVTAGFFAVLGWLLIEGKPTTGGDALLVMLGALGGAWGSVIAYYFGSSAGSRDKTALLGGAVAGRQ
jgi:hypothetical protein